MVRGVQRSLGTGPDIDHEPVWFATMGGAASRKLLVTHLHRDFADLPGRVHVVADEAEPDTNRADPASCDDMDAMDLHVHAGLVRIWACPVLDREQRDHLRAAILYHGDEWQQAGSAGQYRREEEKEGLGRWNGGSRIFSAIL